MNVLERLYEVWNRHDPDGILEFFSDELEYVDQALGLRFSSKQELRDFVAATFDAIPDLAFELTGSFATDAHCAGEAVMRGTQTKDPPGLPASGKHVALRGISIWRVTNGRLSEEWSEFDEERVLRAVGAMK